MTFTAEAFLALLTMLGCLGSVAVHLLVSINNKVSRLASDAAVTTAVTKEKIEALERHQRRNDLETQQMRRHLKLPEPQHQSVS